jgi:hypothetical protein
VPCRCCGRRPSAISSPPVFLLRPSAKLGYLGIERIGIARSTPTYQRRFFLPARGLFLRSVAAVEHHRPGLVIFG